MRTALVCDRDTRICEKIRDHLTALGCVQVLTCGQRDNALELALTHRPQLVFLEAASPVAGLKLADALRHTYAPIIILLVAAAGELPDNQAPIGLVDSFLAKSALRQETELTLKVALHLAQQTAHLRQELATAQQALSDRKLIERAKGLVMEYERLSEEQAYRRMRSQAMERRISMTRLAEEILRHGRQTT